MEGIDLTGKAVKLHLKENKFRFEGMVTSDSEKFLTIKDFRSNELKMFAVDSILCLEVVEA